MSSLPIVTVEDIVNWSYCPLRVWWKGRRLTGTEGSYRQTSEQLIKNAVRTSIKAYYNAAKGGKSVSFSELLDYQWDRSLQKWGLSDLKPKMIEYSDRKRAILNTSSKTKENTLTEDGERLFQPLVTRHWTESAISNGLLDLRKTIDRQQERAGLGVVLLPDDQMYSGPSGLADAYTTSCIIGKQLEDSLPPVEQYSGSKIPVGVDLLSVRLITTADIVLDLGQEKYGKEGRPPKDEIPRRELFYEMHLYDENPPSYNGFARDLRLMTLRQALPDGQDQKTSVVKGVSVRFLQTGAAQEFSVQQGADIDILESLAKAFLNGQRAGVYIPRMIGGWDACGNCEYRPLCFTSNSDVMRTRNPPFEAQIQSNQRDSTDLKELIIDITKSGDTSIPGVMTRLLEWMKESPELTVDSVANILESIEENHRGVS